MSETAFNPFETGALHNRHRDRWQLETDVAEMTLDVLASGAYLPRFSEREHPGDYAYRRGMSVPLDMCRDGVRIRVDNLWRTPPRREVRPGRWAALLDGLIHDADADGTPLDAFMRRAAWNHYVTGVDVVTQVTAVPEGARIRTRADERRHRVRPYFCQFSPLQRFDWAANGSGGFLWARYCLGERPAADEAGGPPGATEFLTLTATEWRRHTAVRRRGGDPEVRTLRGPHAFGRPPIVKLYYAESAKSGQGGVPLSLLTRPAVVAKVAMNVKSQADADLLAAVTRWFATGVQGEEIPDCYGPNALVKFPNPDSRIAVLQGDVGHIAEKRAWLLLYLGEILRLLKFRGGMAEIEAGAGSGLKLALERTDLDNELRATAAQLERTELEMMRQAAAMAGGEVIPPERAAEALGYSVHYNRDFVLEPLGEMLENVARYVRDCPAVAAEVPAILREMLRQVAHMLAREGSPAAERMRAEIDAASFAGPDAPARAAAAAGADEADV